MVSTGGDLEEVIFGENGVVDGRAGPLPRILVDCSSIGVEESQAIRARVKELGSRLLAAPVSGRTVRSTATV